MRLMDWLRGIFGKKPLEKPTDPREIPIVIWDADDGSGLIQCSVEVRTSIVYPTIVMIQAHDIASAFSTVQAHIQDGKLILSTDGLHWTSHTVHSSQVSIKE